MPFYLYCCNSFVEAQKAGITFMPKHGNMRLDRSQSKKQWAEYIQAGIQGFNDVHSMQNIVSLVLVTHVPDNNKIHKGNNNWEIDQKIVSVYI